MNPVRMLAKESNKVRHTLEDCLTGLAGLAIAGAAVAYAAVRVGPASAVSA
jgi:hypothetical protein